MGRLNQGPCQRERLPTSCPRRLARFRTPRSQRGNRGSKSRRGRPFRFVDLPRSFKWQDACLFNRLLEVRVLPSGLDAGHSMA